MGSTFHFVAGGNINRARFVTPSSTAGQVTQATAAAFCIGIGAEYAEVAPITGAADYAATANNPIQVYGIDQECYLTAGAAITAGARLKSDSTGRGVVVSSTDKYFAVALQAASAADEKIKVIFRNGVEA